MEAIKLTGAVRTVGVVVEKGNFKSQLITINAEEFSDYPQVYSVQFAGKNIGLLAGVTLGNNVELECNLKGKAWVNAEGKEIIFTTIDCFKLKKL